MTMAWGRLNLAVLVVATACAITAIPDRSALKETLHAARTELFRAMREQDARALNALLDDEFTFTHATGLVENKAAFVARLMAARMPPADLEFTDEDIRMRGNVVLWQTQSHRKSSTGDAGLDFRALDVLAWQDGHWRWLAVHSTRVTSTR